MKQRYDKQEIAQLLSKFMAGETSVAEEEVLARYFRSHEVDEEWTEIKEMFAMFDDGQVDIEADADTSDSFHSTDSDKLPKQPKTVKEKPKIIALRWLMVGIAASIALLIVFHFGRSTAEQPSMVAEKNVVAKDSVQPRHEAIIPTERTEEAVVAQVTKRPVTQTAKRPVTQTTNSASTTESLADCIARLEAEMESLDDSVSTAHVEKLIAADVRLQQMVNRIVGKQAEQAMNKIINDSTANYVSF